MSGETKKRIEFGPQQIGGINYVCLLVCVIAQLATIIISWPAWQVRHAPPNLPWIEATPQLSCGILVCLSLIPVLLSPRKYGMGIHLSVVFLAIVMDQFRCQPQILCVTFMMSACVWPTARRICVWYLVAMWLWAGLHKFLSPEWKMQIAENLLIAVEYRISSSDNSWNFKEHYFLFAMLVAGSETLLGILAWLRPRWGAVLCSLVHFGIAGFMVLIHWNQSVIPWNICTAIVGSWLIWNRGNFDVDDQKTNENASRPLGFPTHIWQKLIVVVLLIIPVATYFGAVRHCFCHVLYSGNLPMAVVTQADGAKLIESWQELDFPCPNEHKTYRDYFRAVGKPGDKMHAYDPRYGLWSDYFYEMTNSGAIQLIPKSKFFETKKKLPSGRNVVLGIGHDDPQAIFLLTQAGAILKRRPDEVMVCEVEIAPEFFQPDFLEFIRRLPNVEAIDLTGCAVQDEDLKHLAESPMLMDLGLSHTRVTDAGLSFLKSVPRLRVIEHAGTLITAKGLETLELRK